MKKSTKPRVVIIGNGTAGIMMSARLRRKGIPTTIIGPSEFHYYQPFWTLVGAGVAKKESTQKRTEEVMPKGVEWIKDIVKSIQPTENQLETGSGKKVSYDYLVVCPGLQTRFDMIEGLEGGIDYPGISSIYTYDTVDSVWDNIRNFKGGKAIFTKPATAIKCGGAPQKIMYLAESYFRRNQVRDKSEVHFFDSGKSIFGVESFKKTLEAIISSRKIQAHFCHVLKAVDPEKKEVSFSVMEDGKEASVYKTNYDFLHVVPPMVPPALIKESGLSGGEGQDWMEVNIETLQSSKYENIFGLGDVVKLPTAKTGAAIRKQAPIVVNNILSHWDKMPEGQFEKYNGYSSCPLVTDYGKVVLAEFGYNNKVLPSFPLIDMAKERFSMWILKTKVLPVLYWKLMLKGLI
jgi:sulfide:quinone oxidoreductase